MRADRYERHAGWRTMGVATIAVALTVAVLPAAALAASSPSEVKTEPAEPTPSGFKLQGKLNPNGAPTTYYFIYKQADAVECEDLEGCGPETTHGGPLTGDTQQEVSPAEVTGLEPNTAYVYWLIAKNANGTAVGKRLGFTTPPATPSINGESVSSVTEDDATLEAQIDVEGLKHGADYQFQIVQNPSEYASELICPSTRPEGHEICVGPQSPGVAPIGFVPSDEAGPLKSSEVSLDLAGAGITLKPGTTYHYRVIAARSKPSEDTIEWEGPTVYGADQTFTTSSAGTPPTEVLTGPAEATQTGYKLTGKLNPDGLPTTYYYEYIGSNEIECLDIEPGMERCWHKTAHVGPITGDIQQEVPPIEVTGLTAGVTYHYRLVATNADRTVFGNEASFTVGSPPVVDSVSLSNLTTSDATLQAQIDTEGLATTYEFHMWSSCAHQQCEDMMNIPLPSGSLLGSFVPQTVSLDLNSAGVTLRYGQEYGWGITATSAAGQTSMSGGVFEPPPPSTIEPLSTTTSLVSGSNQPAGLGDSSFSPTSGVRALGTQVGKQPTTKPRSLTNARKLAKALKACEKKPKSKRTACEKQAHNKYGTSASRATKR